VESLDEALAKVPAPGVSITVEKTDLGGGWYAAVTDREGSEIGIWEAKAG
jgi:predicted enzyme related to lactoylglutathione lyase